MRRARYICLFFRLFVVYYSVGLKSPCFAVRPWSLLSFSLPLSHPSLHATLRCDAKHVCTLPSVYIHGVTHPFPFLPCPFSLSLSSCLSPSLHPHHNLLLSFVFIFTFSALSLPPFPRFVVVVVWRTENRQQLEDNIMRKKKEREREQRENWGPLIQRSERLCDKWVRELLSLLSFLAIISTFVLFCYSF